MYQHIDAGRGCEEWLSAWIFRAKIVINILRALRPEDPACARAYAVDESRIRPPTAVAHTAKTSIPVLLASAAIGKVIFTSRDEMRSLHFIVVLDVSESRLRVEFRGDAFRVVYAVQLADEIWVVHAFQKKSTQGIKTLKHEVHLIKDRLKRLKEMLR